MVDQFEFIDCPSISISYQTTGLATVSFTVVSTEQVPGVNPPRDYTILSFGGIDFQGFITNVVSGVIAASLPPVFCRLSKSIPSGACGGQYNAVL